MTIDFRAGDPGSGNEPTNFNANPGDPGNDPGSDDQTVVLEIGDRKFTRADLVKKITNADQHIATLTGELQEQRTLLTSVNETLKKQVNAQEVLERLKAGTQPPATQPPTSSQPPATPVATPDDVASLVLKQLEQAEQVKKEQENWSDVTRQLTGAFGDAVNRKVSETIGELGMTAEDAERMARTRPKAFLKLFDLQKPVVNSGIGRQGANSQALKAKPAGSTNYHKARNTNDQIQSYESVLARKLSQS